MKINTARRMTGSQIRRISKSLGVGALLVLLGATPVHAEGNAPSYALKDVAETSQAQEPIKGTIVDTNGEPLIGVSVAVKGTTSGTLTDLDGNFTLKAEVGNTIVISYVGYNTQEIRVKNTNNIDVVLKESDIALDAVVVTALGIKREQKALSYNVQEIKGDELLGVKDANMINSLAGKVAGVNITTSSSGVGGATRVVMRGTKSLSKDNNALYVIDGVPIFNNNSGSLSNNTEYADQPGGEGISDINPEDIESMTVLTGPSAAALYGANAANGAIIITTKKGIEGKPKVTITNQTTFSRPFVMPDFQSQYGNRKGEYKSWSNEANGNGYDPKDFFDTGTSIQTAATLSVGNSTNQTYMSLGNTTSDGIIPDNEYRKNNVTLRNTTKFLNDKLTLDFGFSYIRQKDKNMMAQGQYYNPLLPAYTYPRNEDFNANKNFESYDPSTELMKQNWTWGDQNLTMQNPYWTLKRDQRRNQKDRYMMNVNLKYEIADWINVMVRGRIDNSYNKYSLEKHAFTEEKLSSSTTTGELKSVKTDDKQAYGDLLVNINKYFGDFSLGANVGASISDMRQIQNGVNGRLMVPNYFAWSNLDRSFPKLETIENGWHEQTQSVFANVEVGWKSMLYLTVTGRNDWSSALAKTKDKSFFYPSVGLSGVVSEMVKLPEAISYLQVRGSYASVGSAIPRNLSITTYPLSEPGKWGTVSYMPLSEMKPERTGNWELGLSSKFWDNRLTFDLTWYKSNTKKQTIQVPISPTSGYGSLYVQAGDVQNTGLEMALGGNNKFGDFNWSTMLTASYNKNKIKKLMEDNKYFDPEGNPLKVDRIEQGGVGSAQFILTEGGTMGDLYVKKKLKRNDDGSIFTTDEGKPVLENTMDKVGTVLPKWNLGFRNDFRWKDINFGFLITARFGGKVISETQAILDGFGVGANTAAARNMGGVPDGRGGLIDAEKYYSVTGAQEGLVGDYVYSANNIRLQELTVGYNLPSKWFNNIMKVNVAFVGRNLWMIKNKAPFDPESTASTGTYYQGFDYFMQPSLRNLGFSVRVEF